MTGENPLLGEQGALFRLDLLSVESNPSETVPLCTAEDVPQSASDLVLRKCDSYWRGMPFQRSDSMALGNLKMQLGTTLETTDDESASACSEREGDFSSVRAML